MSIRQKVGRRLGWLLQHPLNTGKYFYGDLHFISAGERLESRWNDLARIGDFRPTDTALDVGCAEGLISLEVAKLVSRVHGIDIDANRVERARLEAHKRGAANATFELGSVIDYPLDPGGYDVTLFLSVFGKHNTARVGVRELVRLLKVTRRQILVRANVQTTDAGAVLLSEILSAMDEQDFDAFCFPAPPTGATNVIVGCRRGTDARLPSAPAFVLLPTEQFRNRPCLRDAQLRVKV